MDEVLRKISIAFAAGALGAGARFAVLALADATGLAGAIHPPLGWFLTADYIFQQTALGALLGLALAVPLLARIPILRGLILGAGLAALMLLSADLGAPERFAALGDASWTGMWKKVAPIAGVSGLIWGCVAALFYGAATKPEVHEGIEWDEAESDAGVQQADAATRIRQAAMIQRQGPTALEHRPVPEPGQGTPVEAVLIPAPNRSRDGDE